MTSAAKSLLADIQSIAPDIAARAAEIEAGRGIPIDLVEALRSVGVFRLLVPRSHGGLEFELPEALEVIAAFSKIEGSVGWIAMIAGGTQLLAPLLPRETYDQVYRNGPDVIIAGSNQPAGTAEAISGGWRVSGRWPFASGSQHANLGGCTDCHTPGHFSGSRIWLDTSPALTWGSRCPGSVSLLVGTSRR
jgi:indole-3-acetate monooxygenase